MNPSAFAPEAALPSRQPAALQVLEFDCRGRYALVGGQRWEQGGRTRRRRPQGSVTQESRADV